MRINSRLIYSGIVLALIISLTACNPLEKEAKSASLLTVESIIGKTATGDAAQFLQSDVQRMVSGRAVYDTDTIEVSLRASLLNPASITGPSQYNNIILTSFRVSYLLPDGTGTPGTTVPLPIENSLATFTIPIDQSVKIVIPAVLDSAKTRVPLSALAGTLNTLQVNAVIEFFGEDLTRKKVKAKGNLPIFFADYVDPPPPTGAASIKK